MAHSFPNHTHKLHFVGNYAPIDLLKYAGLVTWICAAIPLVFHYWIYPNPLPPVVLLAWLLLHLLFGAAYWYFARQLPKRRPVVESLITLALMTFSALMIGHLSQTAVAGILLLIVAGLLPWMLPLAASFAWLLGQNIALAIVINLIPGVTSTGAVMLAGMFLGVSLFAFMAGLVGLRNIRARIELARVNSELRATQSLLAENTRIAERVRIARELHDLVGHHLTALTLNLEVVTHLVDGKVLGHVQQAHSLAKLLLADVREVVSEMRKDDRVDLQQVLLALTTGVPEPEVHLDIPPSLTLTDPQQAQIILRCVQEAVTNCVKHAKAKNLWISVEMLENSLQMTAVDDGIGSKELKMGNGLEGMQERVELLGGTLDIQSIPGQGFVLTVNLPTRSL
ncbi:MAG: sensor histidine kinase [Xanthomonadales bacterium]|nr:sensor histidine kinase [Xanthomonadales bacterium]